MAGIAFTLLLIAAILARYKDSPRWWGTAFIASIVTAYLASMIEVSAIIMAVTLITLSHYYSKIINSTGRLSFYLWKTSVWTVLVILSLLLATHAAPGFNNILIHDEVVLSQNSTSFSIYANYDKALVGMALLLLLANGSNNLQAFFRNGLHLLGITAIAILGTATLTGYIKWEPKFETVFFTWAITNLLVTCLAEEAFFRLLIQEQVLKWCSRLAHKEWIAIIIAGSLFGLAHLGGGATYAILATVAGVCYAYIYHRYRSISVAVAVHFLVNATHFLLFTYPASG